MTDLPLARVCGKYRLKKKIGSGAFGDVFFATNIMNGVDLAVKLEPYDTDNQKLREEWQVYKALGKAKGIPRVFWFGAEGNYRAMVMTLLGLSLGDLFAKSNQKFSVKTVILLAIQLISRIEYIHDHNYVHCDIKPENLLMGTPGHRSESLVHIADFGLSILYRDPVSSAHFPYSWTTTITGTFRYLSMNGHKGIEPTRRDDLESLAYVLIYFLRGSLPWQGLKARSRKRKIKLVMKKKARSAARLCKKLPKVFETFLDYARDLSYDATPDYAYLRSIFYCALDLEGYTIDNIFDWSPTDISTSCSQFQKGQSSSDDSNCHSASSYRYRRRPAFRYIKTCYDLDTDSEDSSLVL